MATAIGLDGQEHDVSYFTNQALAAGYSQATIDDYYARNGVQDAGSILSRLAPNPGPGGGVVTAPASTAPFAAPTPLATDIGAITVPSPSDSVLVVHGSIVPKISPAVDPVAVAGGATAGVSAPAIDPLWVFVGVALVIAVLLWEK